MPWRMLLICNPAIVRRRDLIRLWGLAEAIDRRARFHLDQPQSTLAPDFVRIAGIVAAFARALPGFALHAWRVKELRLSTTSASLQVRKATMH